MDIYIPWVCPWGSVGGSSLSFRLSIRWTSSAHMNKHERWINQSGWHEHICFDEQPIIASLSSSVIIHPHPRSAAALSLRPAALCASPHHRCCSTASTRDATSAPQRAHYGPCSSTERGARRNDVIYPVLGRLLWKCNRLNKEYNDLF